MRSAAAYTAITGRKLEPGTKRLVSLLDHLDDALDSRDLSMNTGQAWVAGKWRSTVLLSQPAMYRGEVVEPGDVAILAADHPAFVAWLDGSLIRLAGATAATDRLAAMAGAANTFAVYVRALSAQGLTDEAITADAGVRSRVGALLEAETVAADEFAATLMAGARPLARPPLERWLTSDAGLL
jgi:hypothetical protein